MATLQLTLNLTLKTDCFPVEYELFESYIARYLEIPGIGSSRVSREMAEINLNAHIVDLATGQQQDGYIKRVITDNIDKFTFKIIR